MYHAIREVVHACLRWLLQRVLGVRHTRDSLGDVRKAVESGTAVLIDVREPSEWEAGHLREAVLIPLSRMHTGICIESTLQHLPSDKPIYVHCGAGGRCLIAAARLRNLGIHRDIRPLKPGYQELVWAGFPQAEA